jgi:anti-sigma regulatory factor (Ser/Thr protein kinase)
VSECNLWLEAEPYALKGARAAIGRAAARAGFDHAATFEITVAASEALNNAIEHGAPCEDGKILLSLAPATGSLAIEVADCGHFVPPVASADPLPERGRGVAMMRNLVDTVELGTRDDRTYVRLVKRVGLRAGAV